MNERQQRAVDAFLAADPVARELLARFASLLAVRMLAELAGEAAARGHLWACGACARGWLGQPSTHDLACPHRDVGA